MASRNHAAPRAGGTSYLATLLALLAIALAGGLSSVLMFTQYDLQHAAQTWAARNYQSALEHTVSRVLSDFADDGRVGAFTCRKLDGFLAAYQDMEVPFGSYQDATELQSLLAAQQSTELDVDRCLRIMDICFTTLCYAAVRRGDARRLEELLNQGAVVNSSEAWSRMYVDYHPGMYLQTEPLSMLEVAATLGYTDIVRLLIDAGADLEASPTVTQRTALHRAAANGHAEVVQLLVDAGAKVDALSQIRQTPLDEALAAGHQDVAAILRNAVAESPPESK
jgi:hypothetical protein